MMMSQIRGLAIYVTHHQQATGEVCDHLSPHRALPEVQAVEAKTSLAVPVVAQLGMMRLGALRAEVRLSHHSGTRSAHPASNAQYFHKTLVVAGAAKPQEAWSR